MSDIETQIRTYATGLLDRVEPVTADEARQRARRSRTQLRLGAIAAAIALVAGLAAIVVRQDDSTTAVGGGPGGYPLTIDGHRDWQLALFAGRDATDDEIRARLSDEFLAAVPASKFRENVATIRSLGKWHILREVERRSDALAVQLAADSGQQARLTIAVDSDGRMAGSTFLLATPCAPAVSPSDALLDEPLDQQVRWYLDLANSSTAVTEDEMTSHFSPDFLAQIGGAGALATAQARVRDLGPFTERSYEGEPSKVEANLRLGTRSGEEARLRILIEPDVPHRITALSVLTQQPCASP